MLQTLARDDFKRSNSIRFEPSIRRQTTKHLNSAGQQSYRKRAGYACRRGRDGDGGRCGARGSNIGEVLCSGQQSPHTVRCAVVGGRYLYWRCAYQVGWPCRGEGACDHFLISIGFSRFVPPVVMKWSLVWLEGWSLIDIGLFWKIGRLGSGFSVAMFFAQRYCKVPSTGILGSPVRKVASSLRAIGLSNRHV